MACIVEMERPIFKITTELPKAPGKQKQANKTLKNKYKVGGRMLSVCETHYKTIIIKTAWYEHKASPRTQSYQVHPREKE